MSDSKPKGISNAGEVVNSVPAGRRIYAVGDIHGCVAELKQLLATISAEIEAFSGEAHIIFLGDLIDRGPDSAGVVRTLRSGLLPGKRHSFLLGNHEEAFVSAYDVDVKALGEWLSFGGIETLESYGIARGEIFRLGADLSRRMRQVIPAGDIAFLRRMDDQLRVGDYLFVHAGIKPGTPLPEQKSHDLRWIRNEFLNDETNHGVTVVHGHTISEEPQVRPNRIGIDTGCYRTGHLTALVLEGRSRRFVST